MLLPLYIILTCFLFLYIIAIIIKNNSIVDIFWGLGYVVVALYLFLTHTYSIYKFIILILVSLWGVRLFIHIGVRNLFKGEDFRYRNWRESWGKWVHIRAFIQVFLLQGLLMYVIGSGIFYFMIYDGEFNWLSYIGIIIYLIGFYFEAKGDHELRKFMKKKDKEPLLKTGMWGITRHPNYTGESILWFGIFITLFGAGIPFYYIVSPLTITLILRFISIPLLEDKMRKRKGWEAYSKEVPMMFPLLKK